MNDGARTRSVLLVTHYYPGHGGGVEIVAGQIAQRIAAAGAHVEWFASAVDAAPDWPGVVCRPQAALNFSERLWGIPFPLWGPLSILRLIRAVRRHDVVHLHDTVYFANVVAAACALVMGKRLVVTQHVGEIPYRRRALRALLAFANRFLAHGILRRADRAAFVSPVVRSYFERLGAPKNSFVDVPNGVDTLLFSPSDEVERAACRRELGIAPDRPLALFVGRFVEKKGLRLVETLASRTPAWQWCLAGHGPIDAASWRLPNVRLLGRLAQGELSTWYRAADVLVLPSVGEGFPLVVQEALAAGLPVAVHTETRDAGSLSPDVCVVEDVNGDDAPSRWLSALERIMTMSRETRVLQRARCRQFAVDRWSWDATSRRYETLLFDAQP